jgi:surface antigen
VFTTRLLNWRWGLALLILLAAAVGVIAKAPNASANATICTGYQGCVSSGHPDHGYGANSGNSYWGMFMGHNCTNYVAYMESLYGVSSPGGLGNASTWGPVAAAKGYLVDGNPAVGAVAWWAANAGRGSSGHVAYVEGVNSDGSVTVSQDVWGGNYSWEIIPKTSPSGYVHFKDKPHYHPLVGDFNGDGQMDVGLKDDNNGVFYFKFGPSFTTQTAYQWAPGSHYKAFSADFNGDGITDIGLQDPNNGAFYIKHGPTFTDQQVYGWAPGWHYEPFVGDFNGDRVADIGLRDPSNGVLYIRFGPTFGPQIAVSWAPGEHYEPFAPDFNGDGLADLALRDPNNGVMYIKYGPDYGTQVAYNWAPGPHYQPIAGDLNGDHLSELGLRDPNNGLFYFRFSPAYNTETAVGWAAG